MNLKCKAETCPLKQHCKTYDKTIGVKTVGVHFSMNPYYYNWGLFTCHEYKGVRKRYTELKEKNIQDN